ncbi:hypothetical protein CC86DRAFT_388089 [Ophiobolus disseminans]|uniref:Uncharacterized protein n=1 Tax=Ophiobolus disseminans TaxID=1469910 RepID=A0A6A6ZE36_9PLEO|nr:hypothetical protein CC86DRAFT_388089 [Ophiobolus disseminans]
MLRKLELYIDHDDRQSWNVVNERAFLSPLDALSSIQHLHISVNLPKLHPRHETSKRHFVPTLNLPPYNIHRKLRQRCYAVDDENDGSLVVECFPDFPILYEDSDEDLEATKQKERRMWERGVDVEAKLSAPSAIHMHRNCFSATAAPATHDTSNDTQICLEDRAPSYQLQNPRLGRRPSTHMPASLSSCHTITSTTKHATFGIVKDNAEKQQSENSPHLKATTKTATTHVLLDLLLHPLRLEDQNTIPADQHLLETQSINIVHQHHEYEQVDGAEEEKRDRGQGEDGRSEHDGRDENGRSEHESETQDRSKGNLGMKAMAKVEASPKTGTRSHIRRKTFRPRIRGRIKKKRSGAWRMREIFGRRFGMRDMGDCGGD